MNYSLKKQKTLNLINDLQIASRNIFLAKYHGISSNDLNTIRQMLREGQMKAIVAKNTLFKKAISESSFRQLGDSIKEDNIIIFSKGDVCEDAKFISRVLSRFSELKLTYMATAQGLLGDKKAFDVYSQLPNKIEILSSLVLEINKPMTSLFTYIDNVNRSVIDVLQSLTEKK